MNAGRLHSREHLCFAPSSWAHEREDSRGGESREACFDEDYYGFEARDPWSVDARKKLDSTMIPSSSLIEEEGLFKGNSRNRRAVKSGWLRDHQQYHSLRNTGSTSGALVSSLKRRRGGALQGDRLIRVRYGSS